MDLSEFTLHLLFVFLPGIVAFLVVDKLTCHQRYASYEVLLGTFLLGVLSYFILFGLECACLPVWSWLSGNGMSLSVPQLAFVQSLQGKTGWSAGEIALATLAAFPVGLISAYAINAKWLFRFGRLKRVGVSNKHGDISVLNYVLNHRCRDFWITVRDRKHGLAFQVYLVAYPDGENREEIFLKDVQVYDIVNRGLLYEAKGVYISRNMDDVEIEMHVLHEEGDDKCQKTKVPEQSEASSPKEQEKE